MEVPWEYMFLQSERRVLTRAPAPPLVRRSPELCSGKGGLTPPLQREVLLLPFVVDVIRIRYRLG